MSLSDAVAARCQAEIAAAQREAEVASGARVVWGLVDGFLLYWDQVYARLACYSSPSTADDEFFLVRRRLSTH